MSSADRLAAYRRARGRPAPRTQRVVRVRGLDLAVWTTPDVPGTTPLLCINGGLIFDHGSLWPSLAPLADARQLVFYDQRGRGRSAPPPGPRAARIEHDAGDVVALREALGLDRYDLLGHSWGGGIAMIAAAHEAQRGDAVRRLVLVDPVAPTGWWLPLMHERAVGRLPEPARSALAALDPARLADPDPALHAGYARAFAPAWFADLALAPLFTPPLVETVTGSAIAARLRRDGYDWRDQVAQIRARTLVVRGEADALPPEVHAEVVAAIAGARLATIAGAGHMPFWERPEDFAPLVAAFLDAPA